VAPNLVTVAVGASRVVDLYNHTGSLDLVADLAGYYSTDPGAMFTALRPTHVLDTHGGLGTGGRTAPVGADSDIALDLSATVPANATAVVFELTGSDVTAPTFLTAWPDGSTRPLASNLNPTTGVTAGNEVVSPLGTNGVDLYNHSGNIDLAADIAGYFAPSTACVANCPFGWGNQLSIGIGAPQTDPTTAAASPQPLFGLSGVVAFAGGNLAEYALRSDGTVWAWGSNANGQLGNGETWTDSNNCRFAPTYSPCWSNVPVKVPGLTQVTAIAAAGLPAALALRQDGTVWTFGTGTTTAQIPPAQVAGLSGVTAIAGSGGDAYALRSDGTVWAWGDNISGELGNGSSVVGTTNPVQVSGLTGVTAIAAGGSDATALKSDGTVWMWGGLAAGFGGGTPGTSSNVPVQVTGLANVTSITSSGITGGLATSLAIESDGTLWAWGDDTYGQLGNGTHSSTVSYTATRVSGLPKVTSAATGWTNSYAVGADGSAWAWGFNNAGQLANGVVGQACLSSPMPAGCESDVPVTISGLTGVTSIAAGGYLGLPTAYAIVG
ncbi:MAG TPA: hypothetical protein VGL06_14975, partial [Pseudonocardiaceae bacterium]